MRVIEIIADAGHLDTLTGIAEHHGVTDFWYGSEGEDGRRVLRMLVDDKSRQAVVDALQNLLGSSDNARIVIMPVEASLPRTDDDADPENKKGAQKHHRGWNARSVINGSGIGRRFRGFLPNDG